MDAYNFNLPEELIAQLPAAPRDHARLLVYRVGNGSITDDHFYNLGKYLPKKATIVVNDSKVDQCRWLFDNNKTELFVVEKLDTRSIRAMVRPGRKFKVGSVVRLTDWLEVEVTDIDSEGLRTLHLNIQHDDERLKKYEHTPLPPYIRQDDSLAEEYQTVYAKPHGSLAAPTAGLHFTKELLSDVGRHHPLAEITLHVGLGTFAPLRKKNFATNSLHAESYGISKETAKKLNDALHRTAVGTTTTRTLESAIGGDGLFTEKRGETEIFIHPGYHFKATDSLITNFHLPGTSLLLLVAAFLADKKQLTEHEAREELLKIYAHAINLKYRFYSFGDAMLIV